jgi:hypothetical protein
MANRTQVLAAEETIPGTEITSFAGANVLEVLEADFAGNRPLLDRSPASETMSNPKKALGPSDGTLSFGVDWRGGAASQKPDFDGLLQACGMYSTDARTITMSTGGLVEAVVPGQVLQGATSGARAIVMEPASLTDLSVVVVIVTPDTAFSALETLENKTTGNDAGPYASDATIANTSGYHPLSKRRLKMTTTGSWSTAAVGDGVTFQTGTAAISGGGIILKISGTTTWVEMTWGDVLANDNMVATDGDTNTVAGTPAFDQDFWPTYTIRQNRRNLVRAIYGAVGTFGFTAEAGAGMQGTFDFAGKKGAHTDGAFVAPTTRNSKLPPRFIKSGSKAYAHVDGVKLPVISGEFTLDGENAPQRDGNRAEGVYINQSTGRSPKVTLVINQVPTATWDYDTLHKNGTTVILDIRLDGGTLNGFTFVAGAAQIAEVSDSEDGDLPTMSITFELARTIEDDEFAFRFSTL